MIKLSYEVSEVTDFLDNEKSQFIKHYMTSVKFPWLYSNCSTEIGDGNSMFSNVLYSDNQENKYYSPICEDLIKVPFLTTNSFFL